MKITNDRLMIDKDIVSLNYARMDDEQLMYLAQTEGAILEHEALHILKKEFIKRSLDMSVFSVIDESKILQEQDYVIEEQKKQATDFINSIWVYVFDEKSKGIPDEEIRKGLAKKGLDDEDATQVFNTLESKATEAIASRDSQKNWGGFVFAIGTLVTCLTYISAQGGGVFIVAWGAILFGVISFFKGLTGKEKLQRVLENIKTESNTV